jgi:acetyl esterase/lipase
MKPTTIPLPVVAATLRPIYRVMLNPKFSFRTQRALMHFSAKSQPVPDGSVFRQQSIGGVPVERVTVGATERKTVVLYLHGGAFTMGSPFTHRPLTASLAKYTGSVVIVPDYRLAPEHPFPAGLDDAAAVYDSLVDDLGFAPESIVIAGDSAGGGMTVALARRMVDKGRAPAAIALISPWVDPGDRNAPFDRDLLVNTGWSYTSADAYLGSGDRYDPGFAPTHGPLEGLPPTVMHIGTTEVLYQQVRDFGEKLRTAGVDLTYVEYDKLWHVAHLQATLMKEADDAVKHLASFLTEHLRTTQ